jgi:hypothetical protein
MAVAARAAPFVNRAQNESLFIMTMLAAIAI